MTYYHRLSSLNIHFYFSENFGHKHGWSSCWGVQSSSQASVGLTSFQDPQDLLKCMDPVTVENFLCRTKVTPRTFSTDLTFCSQCYSPCLVASHMPTCIYKASRLAPIFHLWTSDPHLTESGLLRKTFFGYCQIKCEKSLHLCFSYGWTQITPIPHSHKERDDTRTRFIRDHLRESSDTSSFQIICADRELDHATTEL